MATQTETLQVTELRSPVRTNDLYLIAVRHFNDYGVDQDGDGIHDALDAAIGVLLGGAR